MAMIIMNKVTAIKDCITLIITSVDFISLPRILGNMQNGYLNNNNQWWESHPSALSLEPGFVGC